MEGLRDFGILESFNSGIGSVSVFHQALQGRDVFLCHAGRDPVFLQTFKALAGLVEGGTYVLLSTIRKKGNNHATIDLPHLL